MLGVGGIVSGLSLVQIGSSAVMLELGYVVCSFLRVSTTEESISVTRPVRE
jgi:hypothetical protein